MELVLKKIDIATLILHMSIMRKNVKKGFKSNYGKQQGKEVLKAYDDVKDLLVEALEGLNEDDTETVIDLSEDNYNVLSSFLNWYVIEVELELEGQHINDEDKQQLSILTKIKDLLKGMKIIA